MKNILWFDIIFWVGRNLILLVCLDFLFSHNLLIILISEILLSIAFYFRN